MIQPEDNKTLPLPLVTEKRGRGRPKKAHALSAAERQAAFRARRKQSGIPVTVTKIIPLAADGYDELVQECDRLREELAQARSDLDAAKREAAGVRQSQAGVGFGIVAIREALYKPVVVDRDFGRARLGFVLDERVRFALARLAAEVGVSKADVLERLVFGVDDAVISSCGDDVGRFYRYLDPERNDKSRD